MRALGRLARARLVESLARVLGHGLQKPVSHPAVRARGSCDHEGLVDERAERVEGGGAADGLGGGEVAAAGEDGQPAQDVPFVRVEQFPGPVDDGTQGLLTGQHGTTAGGEQPEAVVEPVGDLACGQHAQPGRRELDGQGQSVQTPADLRTGLRILLRTEAGAGRRTPLGEQPQRDGLRQRLHGPQQLPWHAEGFTAGGQYRQARTALQQRLHQPGGGLDDVLAVVEDQQHPAAAAVLGEPLDGVVVPLSPGPHRLGAGPVQHGLAGAYGGQYGLRHRLRRVDRREFGQPHAVPRHVPHDLRGLLRQPRLARPAGPEQRDEPGRAEVPPDGLDIGLPTDEGGETGTEVGRRAGGGDSGGGGGGGARGGTVRRVRARGGTVRGVRGRGVGGGRASVGVLVAGARRRGEGVVGGGARRGTERVLAGSTRPRAEGAVADRSGPAARPRPEQLTVQLPQFGARVRAESVGQQAAYVLVGGERLRGAARVAQGAQAQGLEGLVEGVGVTQGGQFGQGAFGVAQGEGGGVAGAQRVQVPGLQSGRLGGAVGQVGEDGPAPQVEGVIEDDGRLRGVVVGQRAGALAGQPLETVQVDVVGRGGEAVSAVHRGDRVRAERPAQSADQRLQRARRVGGRVTVAPHLVDQQPRRDRPPGPQRQHGQQGTQPRPAHGDERAVGAEGLGGAEDAVAHGVHCLRCRRDRSRGFYGVPGRGRAVLSVPAGPPSRPPRSPRSLRR